MNTVEDLLNIARKYAALVAERNLISGEEYTNSMLSFLAASDLACRDVAVRIWETVPQQLQGLFVRSMRRAAEPDFRWHPFHIGGGRTQTEEELRQSADLNTARLRAWAVEFVLFWDAAQAS